MRKASILLAPALAGGALLTGCGGGDDSSSTEAALSKSAYVKQGNAICRQAAHEINAKAQAEFSKQPSQKRLVQFATDTAIPTIEDEISQLRELPPPSGDQDTVNAIYDAAQEGVDEMKQDPSIIAQDKPDAFRKANELAKSYGLTVCAS